MQVEANRSSVAYDPSHEHRARRSLKNIALGTHFRLDLCGHGFCHFSEFLWLSVHNLNTNNSTSFGGLCAPSTDFFPASEEPVQNLFKRLNLN